jgi:thiol-disulfide isomerase/thioredoxin
MVLRLWALLAIFWPAGATYAQAKTTNIQPLTIGDTIPHDLVINNVYNYPVSTIRLPDLKGKLVILDFWATWCGACIGGIPKAQELQKLFKDKLQIIMVNSDTTENAAKVAAFFTRRSQRTSQKITLPYAVQNPVFNAYFPHREIPHYVWINEEGKITGVTNTEDLSAENISALLQDKAKTLLTKQDAKRFNRDKPLLIDENGGENPTAFIYRSIITGYKEYLGAYIGQDGSSQKGIERYFVLNSSILALLRIAYPDVFRNIGAERTIVESNHYASNILLGLKHSDLPENRYCYEIITPPVQPSELKKIMQQDLSRAFNLIAKADKRLMDCYLLRPTNTFTRIKSKGGQEQSEIEPTALKKNFRNQPIGSLSTFLQSVIEKPVISEILSTTKIDLDLPFAIYTYNLKEIQIFLKQNGLLLIPSKKEMEVVTITDRIK